LLRRSSFPACPAVTGRRPTGRLAGRRPAT
jgi:hypothetical protein